MAKYNCSSDRLNARRKLGDLVRRGFNGAAALLETDDQDGSILSMRGPGNYRPKARGVTVTEHVAGGDGAVRTVTRLATREERDVIRAQQAAKIVETHRAANGGQLACGDVTHINGQSIQMG